MYLMGIFIYMEMAFILFSPDCVLSNKVSRALSFLGQHGVGIRAYRWRRLSADEVGFLYHKNRVNRKLSKLDLLVDRLFDFGESLGCLVYPVSGSSQGFLHSRLSGLKGDSDPFMCNEGQLRRVLGATNKLLNLIHTSDSPEDSLREASIFFSDVYKTANSPPIELAGLHNDLEIRGDRRPVSGFQIMCTVKQRIEAQYVNGGPGIFKRLVERELELVCSETDQVSIFPRIRQLLNDQLYQIANTRLDNNNAILLTRLIETALSKDGTYSSQSGNNNLPIEELLRQSGVSVSPWERLILEAEQVGMR